MNGYKSVCEMVQKTLSTVVVLVPLENLANEAVHREQVNTQHIAIKVTSQDEFVYVTICDGQMQLTNIVARWPLRGLDHLQS